MKLVEIGASDEDDVEAMEAQQRFVALEFPAQFGSKVMKYLATNFPPFTELGFAHLKRLKKHSEVPNSLVALVCPLNATDQSVVTPCEQLQQLEQTFEARLTTAHALKHAPRTREVFEKHTKQWPLIFHASIEKAAALPVIEKDEEETMLEHLKATVKRKGLLKGEIQQTSSCACVCVVVDPKVNELVATSEVNDEMLSKYKFTILYHPVMVALDRVAERDRRREKVLKEETAHKKQKCIDEDDKANPKEIKDRQKQHESYLCTGYDVYLDCEPCAMCAMALVHSRTRRVIFDRANPGDGVLVSSFKLHTIKSLNHHFRVFQLSLTSGKQTMD